VSGGGRGGDDLAAGAAGRADDEQVHLTLRAVGSAESLRSVVEETGRGGWRRFLAGAARASLPGRGSRDRVVVIGGGEVRTR
jgi:hypothetical protein